MHTFCAHTVCAQLVHTLIVYTLDVYAVCAQEEDVEVQFIVFIPTPPHQGQHMLSDIASDKS